MKDADLEQILKQSLAAAEPDEQLNENIIEQLKEHSRMKYKYRKKWSVGLLAAALLLVLSISAYAATQLFNAKQIAEHLGDQLLADAFDSKDAIHLNQSQEAGDYRFTLHGLVSGAELSEFPHSSEDIYPDRTYAVVSIARQDGQPMPSTADEDYGKDPFFISPLIKGQKPWMVNIVTMNGGYSETVIDGVQYRLIRSDEIEIFADRGVYLAISSGTSFYSNDAFTYDEATGDIHANEDYNGASLLFELPLDTAKADQEKADAYLEELLHPTASPEPNVETEDEEWINWIDHLRKKIRSGEAIGETIPDSIKEVTYDDAGNIAYTYDGWSATIPLDNLFEEGKVGFTDRKLSISGDADHTYKAVLFHKDENGVITGRIVIIDEDIALLIEQEETE